MKKKIRVSTNSGMSYSFNCEIETEYVVDTSVGLFYKLRKDDIDDVGVYRLAHSGAVIWSNDGLTWSVVNSALDAERIFDNDRRTVLSMFVR